jgi:hypothetical protein
MASAERRCVAHARSEHADLWYYRDTDDGLEYLCATPMHNSVTKSGSHGS